jgi:hypothetical protein
LERSPHRANLSAYSCNNADFLIFLKQSSADRLIKS